jgi:hypothetical protein
MSGAPRRTARPRKRQDVENRRQQLRALGHALTPDASAFAVRERALLRQTPPGRAGRAKGRIPVSPEAIYRSEAGGHAFPLVRFACA